MPIEIKITIIEEKVTARGIEDVAFTRIKVESEKRSLELGECTLNEIKAGELIKPALDLILSDPRICQAIADGNTELIDSRSMSPRRDN